MKKIISKIRKTKGYENLKEILGKELGLLIYKLVDDSEKCDKELDIIHNCITELYNVEINVSTIKKALSDIDNI